MNFYLEYATLSNFGSSDHVCTSEYKKKINVGYDKKSILGWKQAAIAVLTITDHRKHVFDLLHHQAGSLMVYLWQVYLKWSLDQTSDLLYER